MLNEIKATARAVGAWVKDAAERMWPAPQQVYGLLFEPASVPTRSSQLAREGFQENVTVHACVSLLARAVAGIAWLLSRDVGDRRQEVGNHGLLDLLHRPNPEQGGVAFMETLGGHLLISGNAYALAAGPDGRPPRELWPLRPDRVRVEVDARGERHYFYKVSGREDDLPADRVLHLKLFNPTSDVTGLSPIAVAARDIDADNEAQDWNFSLLRNAARPVGALKVKGTLPKVNRDALQRDFDRALAGSRNAGRPIVLDGDVDWTQLSLSPSEMDWIGGRKHSQQLICRVFGVPPELVGDSEHKTYASYEQARKAFYMESALPLVDRIVDALNAWLVPQFGADLVLGYDRDAIEALQEDRAALWERVREADWLTVNEKRRATGYDDIDGGDIVLVSAAMLPLDGGRQDTAKGANGHETKVLTGGHERRDIGRAVATGSGGFRLDDGASRPRGLPDDVRARVEDAVDKVGALLTGLS